MEIACPVCGKVYRVPEEKLSAPAMKARCKACGSVFLIKRDSLQGRESVEGSESREKSPQEHPEYPLSEAGGNEKNLGPPVDEDQSASGGHLANPRSAGEQGRRDYVAIVVLLSAVAALLIVSVLGIKNVDKESVFKSLRSIARVTDFFEKKRPGLTKKARLKKDRQDVRFLHHLSLAHQNFRNKKYDTALREYNLAIRADPGKYEAYYWRGQLFVLKKEYEKAIQDMNRVLRLNPSYQKAHRTLGWAYYEAGRYDEAIGALNRYIDSNPKDGWAFYERGLCYYKKGDVATALKNAKAACDLGFKRGCEVYERYQ